MRETAMGFAPGFATCLAALATTLVLAAWLTPRRWWRRPNLQALAVLGGGTLAFGALFAGFVGAPAATAHTPALAASALPAPQSSSLRSARPTAGANYRVVYALNLRRAGGVDAPRVAVLPAGTLVVATGGLDGDWWQVRVPAEDASGADREGWASSLWLRRADEARRPPLE